MKLLLRRITFICNAGGICSSRYMAPQLIAMGFKIFISYIMLIVQKRFTFLLSAVALLLHKEQDVQECDATKA